MNRRSLRWEERMCAGGEIRGDWRGEEGGVG